MVITPKLLYKKPKVYYFRLNPQRILESFSTESTIEDFETDPNEA